MGAAEGRRGSKGRWVGVGAILFVGWLLMLLGLVGVYMHRTLYNDAVFTKRVTAVLEQPGVCAAGAQPAHLFLDRLDRALHALLGLFLQVVDHRPVPVRGN